MKRTLLRREDEGRVSGREGFSAGHNEMHEDAQEEGREVGSEEDVDEIGEESSDDVGEEGRSRGEVSLRIGGSVPRQKGAPVLGGSRSAG